jgi:hypothetical protein
VGGEVTFLLSGHYEDFKGDCHAAMGVLAGAFALYNACAWLARGDAHLARNAAVYGSLAVLEYHQVQRHRERTRS